MTSRAYVGVMLLAVFAAVLLPCREARADSWTIHDALGSIFVTPDSGNHPADNIFCTSEEDYCSITNDRGDEQAFVLSATGPLGESIPQDGTSYTNRVDELGGEQSDRLYLYATGQLEIEFLYSRNASLGPDEQDSCYYNCGYPELAPIFETGGLQLASTVTWSDGRVDTFYFDSAEDPSPVPEPASLLLLGAGLIAGVRRWKRHAANT